MQFNRVDNFKTWERTRMFQRFSGHQAELQPHSTVGRCTWRFSLRTQRYKPTGGLEHKIRFGHTLVESARHFLLFPWCCFRRKIENGRAKLSCAAHFLASLQSKNNIYYFISKYSSPTQEQNPSRTKTWILVFSTRSSSKNNSLL